MSDYPKPKFTIGDSVCFEISGELEGVIHKMKHTATVVQVTLASTAERRLILYGLTDDPCDAYYTGKGIRWARNEDEIQPT
jgi:hypothetical protein